MFTSFLHSELLETTCTIFHRYQPGVFMFAAIKNRLRLSIFACVLKLEAVNGAFQNILSGFLDKCNLGTNV